MKKENFIYGIHPLLEAIEAGKTIDKVMIQKGLNRETTQKILSPLKNLQVPFQFVPREKLNRITGKNHQGVISFMSPIEYQKIEWLLPTLYEKGETPLILILDRITDVRNFGAICRTAECAGVHAVIIPAKGAAQINADAVKTSAGAVLRIPICRESSLSKTVEYLKESGLKIFACDEYGKEKYHKASFTEPCACIFGSEEDGISKNIKEASQTNISIPMLGQTSSLNVSAATAIVLFEALRQRS
jgi:23S rRNA (guanosine2251-2'-O)-methyltransferase